MKQSFYLRENTSFWMPPHFAARHADATCDAALAFVDLTSEGFAFVIIKGAAKIVQAGAWVGWLCLAASKVDSQISAGMPRP